VNRETREDHLLLRAPMVWPPLLESSAMDRDVPDNASAYHNNFSLTLSLL